MQRIRFNSILILGATAALLMTTPNVSQAQRAHLGPRVGYNFDTHDAFFSLALTAPIAPRVSFYPSVDVYTPETGSRTGFNGDLRVQIPTVQGPELYTGGGVNVLSRSVANRSNTDVGGNLFLGLQGRSGWVHPFAEGRVLIHDNTSFQLSGGLNFTIGR
ncbi:MAG: hypothetical protein U0132_21645 [Gemmatimonadaceae bacterium]